MKKKTAKKATKKNKKTTKKKTPQMGMKKVMMYEVDFGDGHTTICAKLETAEFAERFARACFDDQVAFRMFPHVVTK